MNKGNETGKRPSTIGTQAPFTTKYSLKRKQTNTQYLKNIFICLGRPVFVTDKMHMVYFFNESPFLI